MSTTKEKVYMVCDYADPRRDRYSGDWGDCAGRILREDGSKIGEHFSSSFSFLRFDLTRKLDDPSKYDIIDFVGQPVPDRFRCSRTI